MTATAPTQPERKQTHPDAVDLISETANQDAVTAAAGISMDFSRPDISVQGGGVGGTNGNAEAPVIAPAGAVPTKPGSDSEPAVTANNNTPNGTATAGLTAPLTSLSIASPFGYRTNPLTGTPGERHTGTDYAGSCGTPVLSAAPGVVVEAGFSPYGGGNRIVIKHRNGLKTTYNHLARIGAQVGQSVTRGQMIAGVGTTGNSTGCHLHFEVVVNGETMNPENWL